MQIESKLETVVNNSADELLTRLFQLGIWTGSFLDTTAFLHFGTTAAIWYVLSFRHTYQ